MTKYQYLFGSENKKCRFEDHGDYTIVTCENEYIYETGYA